MARQGFTRQGAIEYLAERGLLTRSPESYKGKQYLQRLAGSFRRQEQEGIDISTPEAVKEARQEARGHARARVEHLEKAGHRLEQYRIEKPPRRDLDMNDLRNLLTRTKKRGDKLTLVIHGVVEDSDPSKRAGGPKEETYPFHAKWGKISEYVKDNPNADILKFAEDVTGLKWESVESISFAYGEGLGRHGRDHAA